MDIASALQEPATGDDDLLAAARARDPHAFAELVTRHRRLIWACCLRVTGDPADAEDALQEALVDIWRGLSAFRGQSAFSTWAYRIAARAALKVARRRRDIPWEEIPEPAPAGFRDLGDDAADHDLVDRCLALVPPVFREAIVLYELCDLTYAEVAEHQGVGIQTVKSRISRARQALADAGRRQQD